MMEKKQMIKRANEAATIQHRDKLEICPDGVNPNAWKVFRERYNDAAVLKKILIPAQIDIELNSNCNLKCTFCIQSTTHIPTVYLDEFKYKKIIDEASILGVTSLKLNYQNEPLMHPRLFQYIEYAKKKGFINIFFSTNGVYLTETVSRQLIHSGVTKIFISLDAFKKETYAKLRVGSNFNKVKTNIIRFLAVRKAAGVRYPLLRINFLKTSANIAELPDFISYWEQKADILNIQDMNSIVNAPDSKLYIEKKDAYKCSMPFKQLVYTASGDILPCCTMHGIFHKLGNVTDMTIMEAWESPKIIELRELHQRGDILKNEICKKCIYG